ncbi:hypothetical protein SAMN06265222_10197 [Neorhodopirellula lusitana]|uniref:Uncharacterized protein n=1 Tax=Neorhodopirellula lusitana TaxID=445327 RepID=A0ABY1PPV0_9BACT|nr:hypothetical protein SAMN06265222_10197 [Neorhodopirellula lusitana]
MCGQAAPQVVTSPENALSKTVVKILRCKGCGAAVAFDPKRQALSCSFCDGAVEIETIEDPMEQTSGYLPFTVTPENAHAALKQWLGSLGWFRPSDLKSSSRVQELRPLWWVAWIVEANTHISWTADSNAGSHRSDWAPHSGQTSVRFQNILASASRGLSDSEVDAISPSLDLNTVQTEPMGAEGATFEQFDVQRSQARRHVHATLQKLATAHVRQSEIPGTRFRNIHVSIVVQGLITKRLSLPAYILAYRYKHKLHRVVISGQDTHFLIGTAPYSVAKIVLVVIAATSFLLLFLLALAAAN